MTHYFYLMNSKFTCSPAYTITARSKTRPPIPTPGPSDYSPIKKVNANPVPIFSRDHSPKYIKM